MSDDRVYVRFKGKTLGPLTLQKVQDLSRRGQITRMHDLSSDGMTWVKAEEFGGVFPSSRVTVEAKSDSVALTNVETNTPVFEASSLSLKSAGVPRPGDAPDRSVEWYAHIGGENCGPMNAMTIQAAVTNGQIARSTLVWRAGFDEWKSAGESLTHLFGPTSTGFGDVKVQSYNGSGTHNLSSTGVGDLYYELHRQRPWVLLLSGLILTCGMLYAIFWIVFMVAGAESRLGNDLTGSVKVITGLIGLTMSGIIIMGGWLLLQYGAALKDIAIHRNDTMPLEAARRLFYFWRFIGIAILTFMISIAATLAIGSMMAAGAGAGAM